MVALVLHLGVVSSIRVPVLDVLLLYEIAHLSFRLDRVVLWLHAHDHNCVPRADWLDRLLLVLLLCP